MYISDRAHLLIGIYIYYVLMPNVLCRAMSKLHTNNHGEIDSIFDAANYSYFLKVFLGNCAEYIVEIHRSFLFLISSNGNLLLYFEFFNKS